MSTIRNGVALGVGPVVVPKYLDRPQIVTRTSKNELHFAEFDQWGGRFEDNFTRALAENLSFLLSTDRVSVYPWKASTPVDYQITVELIHFEGYAAGRTDLAARWSVISGDGREVFLMTRSSFSELARRSAASPEGGQDYEAFVAAMSRALGNLSRDIAAAVLAVSQP